MRKFKISVKLNFDTKRRIAAMLKNGPNGIIFSLSENKMNKAIGKAINVAKKIVQIDIGKPSTNPNKNINLISPPPRDSFLNALSPNILIPYIKMKDPTPA